MISSWEMALYKVELLTPPKKKAVWKPCHHLYFPAAEKVPGSFQDVIINLFAYEAFLPELPHSETKEEGENFCNEISPKTWQQ